MNNYKLNFVIFFMFLSVTLFGQAKIQSDITKQKIVVLNFKSINVDKNLTEAIQENFLTILASTNKYQITERSQLDRIFEEMRLSSSDEFNEKDVLEIGRLAKAQIGFVGSLSKIGSRFTINIRALEISTGNILLARTENANSEDNLIDAIDNIVLQFDPDPTPVKKAETKTDFKNESPELQEMYVKFIKQRNRAISSLVGGGIVASIFLPVSAALAVYANNQIEANPYSDDVEDYETIETIAYLGLIAGGIGALIFVIGIPLLVTSLITYANYKEAQRIGIIVSSYFDSKKDIARFGVKLSFNT